MFSALIIARDSGRSKIELLAGQPPQAPPLKGGDEVCAYSPV